MRERMAATLTRRVSEARHLECGSLVPLWFSFFLSFFLFKSKELLLKSKKSRAMPGHRTPKRLRLG